MRPRQANAQIYETTKQTKQITQGQYISGRYCIWFVKVWHVPVILHVHAQVRGILPTVIDQEFLPWQDVPFGPDIYPAVTVGII